ncbi:caspase family protein [Candidatus Marithioploca araucensis]|uniref:Caspase family protein n=1 Tax=Candidatus Marithioploca araucensis TaxID=70273 RepID=A0ABT7VQK2_9GAMM|nr:caspase family protein [Candidatus Marithioploca araucensis]
MKRLVLILFVFSIISLSAFAKERMALVIGNGNYQVKPLSNPVNDARDMAKLLGELGFDVTLKVNANQMTMESAIEAFGEKLHQNAVGLFYFSGHGAQYAGENYLIPINSIRRTAAAAHLKYKAVPTGYVLGVMPENGLNIVILDACRDNPFKGFSKSLKQGLTRMENAEGSLIAYATAPGTVAWTGEAGERNSPYTKHLLRLMRQPNLSIESLLKKVRKAVIQETRHELTVQKPWYEASISDDFYFVEKTRNEQHNDLPHTILQAEITDIKKVYPAINKGDCLNWSSQEMKAKGGIDKWDSFYPKKGDIGSIVDEMIHCHSGEKIYILKIGQYYVPIRRNGIRVK